MIRCIYIIDTATARIYTHLHTLSLHDALPVYDRSQTASASLYGSTTPERGYDMSKYEPLWAAIHARNEESCMLSFQQIHDILGFDIDHPFLTIKKELIPRGYQVAGIAMKQRTVHFEHIRCRRSDRNTKPLLPLTQSPATPHPTKSDV